MKCPKCGYLRGTKDNVFVPANECPSCGVIYGKLEKTEHLHHKRSQPSGILKNPSPVSAASLVKARERVEQRLRKQQKELHRGPRHIQTLELARRLSAEGVRKRQAEWERQKRNANTQPDQKETTMSTQQHNQPSLTHPPEARAPQSKIKQTARTVAMALKKKKREPLKQSGRHLASDQPTDQTNNEKKVVRLNAGKPKNQRIEAEAATLPNGPTQLFRNQPKGIRETSQKPPTLKEMLMDLDAPDPKQPEVAKVPRHKYKLPRAGLVRLLPIVAWMILSAGVIGAILSWTTMANAQTGMHPSVPTSMAPLPLGLLLGFAYLATGVLGFAFFWVSSLISSQLKDIQSLLLLQSPPETKLKDAG